jgi:choline monooxygenase
MAIEIPTAGDSLGDAVDQGLTLPPEWYFDREIFRLEQEKIFRHAWQYAGHVGHVQKPGDYFTCMAGQIPIVVVRDKENTLRAFVNVCRHRAFNVAKDKGNRKSLQCLYHGWTYGLDGELRGVPHADQEQGFDKCGLGLKPVQVDVCGPLVFVNPDLEGGPLSEVVGELPSVLASRGFDADDYQMPWSYSFDVECNWKINMENTECYHCSVVHPTLATELDTRAGALKYERYNDFFQAYTAPARDPERNKREGVYWQLYYVWPNFWFGVRQDNWIYTFLTLPVDGERCRLVTENWYPTEFDDARCQAESDAAEKVLEEDIAIIEAIQVNQRAVVGGQGRLLPITEALIHSFETQVFNHVTGRR